MEIELYILSDSTLSSRILLDALPLALCTSFRDLHVSVRLEVLTTFCCYLFHSYGGLWRGNWTRSFRDREIEHLI